MQKSPCRKKPCPLFIARSDKEIICKSHVNGADRVAIRYWAKANIETQIECFCTDHYKSCEHYLAYKHFAWEDD